MYEMYFGNKNKAEGKINHLTELQALESVAIMLVSCVT